MNDLQLWSLVVGVAAPPVISVAQQPSWPKWARALVTVLFCLVLGAGTSYFAGDLTGRTWVTSVLLVFVAAITAYQGLWAKLKVTQKIEQATSPAQPVNVDQTGGA